jgi:hypothetical protein
MDERAAEEYHAVLLKRLNKKRSTLDRLLWIPLLGIAAYFALESTPGAVFGTLLGWGICAVLSTLDDVRREIWHVEYLRHLHEYTDEADAGERKFNRDRALDEVVHRWWRS